MKNKKIIIHTLGMGMTWTWSHWKKQTEREREKRKIEGDRVEKQGGRRRGAKEKKNCCEEENRQHRYSNQQMDRGENEPERQRRRTYSTHGERKARTTRSKTNIAAIVTNTPGQKSSNSAVLGGTVGADPAQKSAAYYNKAFYGEVR